MKELSIEEKAKAYDIALAKIKMLLGTGSNCSREDLEYVFPELAESEDERMVNFIKKQLFNIKKTITENYELDAKLTKAIDWLEKQGEQKPVKEQQKEIDYAYRRGLADCHKAYNKEPSETDFIRKEIYDIIAALPLSDKRTGMLLWLESQKFYAVTNKQKPVGWSEEDENMLKTAITSCEQCGNEYAYYWLKSLKDRVQPQPRQEWSEEDENRINRLIAYFEDKESFTAEDDIVYANWLKSLKDRYTWKPSIAQLNALSIVSKGNATDDIEAIVSLYQDLKKLREEDV